MSNLSLVVACQSFLKTVSQPDIISVRIGVRRQNANVMITVHVYNQPALDACLWHVSSSLACRAEARSYERRLEARVGIEPTNAAFAEPCLTTWLPRHGLRQP